MNLADVILLGGVLAVVVFIFVVPMPSWLQKTLGAVTITAVVIRSLAGLFNEPEPPSGIQPDANTQNHEKTDETTVQLDADIHDAAATAHDGTEDPVIHDALDAITDARRQDRDADG